MAAQMVTAMGVTSAVVDEPAHLTSGYLALTQRDLRVNREHPPLVKVLAALPLIPLHPVLPPDPPDAAPRGSEDYEFDASRRFLYHANDADRLLFHARLPIVVLTLLAGLTLYLWARALFGKATALASLAMMAFEPNLLAHGRLVTTDMGATLFTLATIACLERALAHRQSPTGSWWLATGLFLGLGLCSRFSMLLLIPIMAGIVAIDSIVTMPGLARIAAMPGQAIPRGLRPAARLAGLAVALAIALLVLNAGYGLAHGGVGLFPLAAGPVSGPLVTEPLASMTASPVLRYTPLPVPRLFLEGLDLARWKNAHVEGPGYLNGAISADGWWSWFLLALAMKTTIPLLVLSAAGLAWLCLRARDPAGRRKLAPVILPCLGFLILVTAMSRAQIGLRYILPVLPFLCLAAGYAAGELWGSSRRLALALAGPLLLWHAGAALVVHPYHLAYFNEAAGGPDNGYRHLVDSNLDWGQDLGGLKRFLTANGIPRVHLFYFGTADPDYYGIERAAPGEPGYFAVSATHLAGVYLPDPGYLAPFREMAPTATIGHSIRVYRLDTFPSFLKTPIRRK